jgi:hypothetical protein
MKDAKRCQLILLCNEESGCLSKNVLFKIITVRQIVNEIITNMSGTSIWGQITGLWLLLRDFRNR